MTLIEDSVQKIAERGNLRTTESRERQIPAISEWSPYARLFLVMGVLLGGSELASRAFNPPMVRLATALSGSRAYVDPAHPDTVITPFAGGNFPSERMSHRHAGGYFVIVMVGLFAARGRWDTRRFFRTLLLLAGGIVALIALVALHVAIIANASPITRWITRIILPYPHLLPAAAAVITLGWLMRLPRPALPALVILARFLSPEETLFLLLVVGLAWLDSGPRLRRGKTSERMARIDHDTAPISPEPGRNTP